MDIALPFDTQKLTADLAVSGGDLLMDGGLTTAVMISLFTDRRAEADDPIDPFADGGGRRGWPGDLLEASGDRWGSRLWLLDRAKLTEETRLLVQQYITESLAWAVDDGVADRVEVTATIVPPEAIRAVMQMFRGARRLGRWEFVWKAQAEIS